MTAASRGGQSVGHGSPGRVVAGSDEGAGGCPTWTSDGHFRVVDIGDGCADFWEGAVFFVDGVEVKLHPSTGRRLDMTKEG